MRYKDCFDKERRDFLGVIKRAGIATGFIQASSMLAGVLLARTAEAQTGTPSKHLIVFSGGGCDNSKWSGILPAEYSPLQNYASRIAMMGNASYESGGAGHGAMFYRYNVHGSWGSDSFDVNLGKTIGANYPVKCFNVGTTAESNMSRDGYNGIPLTTSPQAALDILFAGGGGGDPGTGTAPRKSVVDLHYAAVSSLQSKLGQHEKDKLDSHFTAIREIESSITSSTGSSGSCPKPSSTSATGFDASCKLLADIVVLALNCNLTASASLAFGTDAHTHYFDKLGRDSHFSHHNQGNFPTYLGEDIAYMQGLTKYLLDSMDAKGLFNSTIVTQVSDMGDANAHGMDNVPMFTMGAGIKGGQKINRGGNDQSELFQTIGLKLKADQSPNGSFYRQWASSPISGI